MSTTSMIAVGRDVLRHTARGWIAAVAVTSLAATVADQPAAADIAFGNEQIITFPNNQWPGHFAAADLTGDGNQDLVVAGRTNDGTVYMLPGNGDGTFGEPDVYELEGQTDRVHLVDLNGDGDLDLALALRTLHGRVAIMFGRGDGTFDPPTYYTTGRLAQGLEPADYDGDGHIDFAMLNYRSGTLRMMWNDGEGIFEIDDPVLINEFASGTVYPHHVRAADLNDSGLPDLVVSCIGTGRPVVFLNEGGRSFSPEISYVLPPDENGVSTSGAMTEIVDLNGDGRPQIVVPTIAVTEAQLFHVYEVNVDGRLESSPASFSSASEGTNWTAAAADLNNNGRLDIAIGLALPGKLAIVENLSEGGTLTFAPPQIYESGGFVRHILPVDLNNDGLPDLVYSRYAEHQLAVRLNETGMPLAGGDGPGDGAEPPGALDGDRSDEQFSTPPRTDGPSLGRWLDRIGDQP